MRTKKYEKYDDPDVLNEISVLLCDRIEDLLKELGVDLTLDRNKYVGRCPIHEGNKVDAFTLYIQGDRYYGYWTCHTHHCHDHFPRLSAVGFIRGVLSRAKHGWEKGGDKKVSHCEAVDYALKFLGIRLDEVKVNRDQVDRQKFIQQVSYINASSREPPPGLYTREELRSRLKIPASYFVQRGYPPDLIDSYDIGIPLNPKSQMYGRVVVPVYSSHGEAVIGCVSRTVHPECTKCHLFHPTGTPCSVSSQRKQAKYAKWISSTMNGFVDKHYLFNYWKAKDYIRRSKTVVIVEGVPDCLRLEEAGLHNSVAIFGSEITGDQRQTLLGSGINTIVVLTDNDAAGDAAAAQVVKKCGFADVVRCPIPDHFKDVGDMTADEVRQHIIPFAHSRMRMR